MWADWFGFLFCVLAILYTIAGYPLWLAWRTRGASPEAANRTSPTAFEPSVTILLPVFNGESWVERKLQSIQALDYPHEKVQTILISDGSTDGTAEKAARFRDSAPEEVRIDVIEIPHAGKPAAINAGLNRARGEILFFTDVRQPLDAQSLRYLTSCFSDPAVGAASGELIIRPGATQQEDSIGLYWRYEKWLRKRESALDSVMGATGAIYAMRRELAGALPEDLLLDDVYLPLLAFFRGYRVIFEERAIAWDDPTSLKTEFRRKVRTQAGVYQLIRYLPQLLGRENRALVVFLSHKAARLLLPVWFVALAFTCWPWPTSRYRKHFRGSASPPRRERSLSCWRRPPWRSPSSSGRAGTFGRRPPVRPPLLRPAVRTDRVVPRTGG
jgi:cellulose synthase/poly-beta-1,6-N-acetylglucosamine synthase-like glycosyltransferase